jgi:hypothetical protein
MKRLSSINAVKMAFIYIEPKRGVVEAHIPRSQGRAQKVKKAGRLRQQWRVVS